MDLPGSFLIIPLAALFFLAAGWSLLRLIEPRTGQASLPFQAGLGYFTGVSLFITLILILAHLLGSARGAFWTTVALMAPLAALFIRRRGFGLFDGLNGRALLIGAAAFGLLTPLVFLFWLTPHESTIPFHASMEPWKYVNLANYFLFTDSLPALTQPYGQSVMALIPLLLGAYEPYLALFLWLDIALLFAFLFFWGLLRWYIPSRGLSLLGAVIVMAGGTAPSLLGHLIIDSGNPTLYNGYSDAVLGTATFLAFLWWMGRVLTEEAAPGWRDFLLPALLTFAWSITAAQNTLQVLGMLGLLFLFFAWADIRANAGVTPRADGRPGPRRAPRLFAAGLVVLASAAAASLLVGGLLAPTVNDPPELAQQFSKRVNRTAILFKPFMATRDFIPANRTRWLPPPYLTDFHWNLREFNWGRGDYLRLAYSFERVVVHSLLLVAFPILGLLFWLLWRLRSSNPDSRPDAPSGSRIGRLLGAETALAAGPGQWSQWDYFILGGAVVFLEGLGVTGLLSIGELKWELTRFLIPGVAAGMCAFAAAGLLLLRAWAPPRFSGLAMGAFALFLVCGPAVMGTATLRLNLDVPRAELLAHVRYVFHDPATLIPWRIYQD